MRRRERRGERREDRRRKGREEREGTVGRGGRREREEERGKKGNGGKKGPNTIPNVDKVNKQKGDTPKLQLKAAHSRWRIRTASHKSRREERKFTTRALRMVFCCVAPTFIVSVTNADAWGLFCETGAFSPSINEMAPLRFRLMNSRWKDVFI